MFRSGFLFDANAVFQLHYFCPRAPRDPLPPLCTLVLPPTGSTASTLYLSSLQLSQVSLRSNADVRRE